MRPCGKKSPTSKNAGNFLKNWENINFSLIRLNEAKQFQPATRQTLAVEPLIQKEFRNPRIQSFRQTAHSFISKTILSVNLRDLSCVQSSVSGSTIPNLTSELTSQKKQNLVAQLTWVTVALYNLKSAVGAKTLVQTTILCFCSLHRLNWTGWRPGA